MPAATDLAPSFTIAAASTVAVVVPSPAASADLEATSRTICAPMFSNLSSSSISLVFREELNRVSLPNFIYNAVIEAL